MAAMSQCLFPNFSKGWTLLKLQGIRSAIGFQMVQGGKCCLYYTCNFSVSLRLLFKKKSKEGGPSHRAVGKVMQDAGWS